MRSFPRYPSRPHSSGKARVTIHGQAVYLDGQHGSKESWSHYRRLLAQWSAEGEAMRVMPRKGLSVAELADIYSDYAKGYYQDGSEFRNLLEGLKPLCRLYGAEPACEMGPTKLKIVRNALLTGSWLTAKEKAARQTNHRRGVCRKTTNQRVKRIVRMWRWAAESELVDASVWQALRSVEGLRAGRDPQARENAPIPPVPVKTAATTLKRLPPAVAAMVRVQLLTGMRPGEVCRLTAAQIDQAGPVVGGVRLWVYRPEMHKTLHHGHARAVVFGPRAQRILARFLAKHSEGPLFRPKGHGACKDRFTTADYGRRIARACKELQLEHWAPNQIRHAVATEIEGTMSLDHARAALGQRSPVVTKVYAAADLKLASEVAVRRG